jgi:prevent-host-death family protein
LELVEAIKRLSVADTKSRFSEVLRSAERGDRTIVMRHGKPVAVVGPFSAEEPRHSLPAPRETGGILSLVGLFDDWESMDRDLGEIIEARQEVVDRPPADPTS